MTARVSVIDNCRTIISFWTGPAAGPRFKEIKVRNVTIKAYLLYYSDLPMEVRK
jgi:hypothetical protein